MTLETYLIYLLAVLVFFATPPDTSQLLIVSNSIAHGLKRNAYTIAGDLSANTVQIAAAAFGLAAVVASFPQVFTWIKWFGVAYLLWIGVQVFRSGGLALRGDGTAHCVSARNLYLQGFLVSLSNPYAILFFGALLPQFIDPTSPIIAQTAILGGTYLIVDGVILLAWGWIGIRAANVLERVSWRLVGQSCGLLLMLAALLLATKNIGTG